MHLLTTLGARVPLVAPPTLQPTGGHRWPVTVGHDLHAVVLDPGPMMLAVRYHLLATQDAAA